MPPAASPRRAAFLTALRSACDATGALLIFDEVMTSRMSAGGAQARTGVIPDLTTLGKYLAGGMTFGAFGGRADVMAAFDPARGGTLTHGGTFNNNVVTMAAGAAALGELLSPQLLDDLYDRGEALRRRIADVLADSPLPMCVSGMGSLMTIHTVARPGAAHRPTSRDADPVLKELLFHELVERGIYLAPRGATSRCRRRSTTPTATVSSTRWRRRHGRSPASRRGAESERGRPPPPVSSGVDGVTRG